MRGRYAIRRRFRWLSPIVPPACAAAVLLLCAALPSHAQAPLPSENEPQPYRMDRDFLQALDRGDRPAIAKFLDMNFQFTNADGVTVNRRQFLLKPPRPAIHPQDGQISRRVYGLVAAVQESLGKVHVLRIWVDRPVGWRLLVDQSVTQSVQAQPPSAGPSHCENPCKTVPFTPANDAERAILASWQQLETAVTLHAPNAWAPHFLEEFVLVASGGTHPVTKSERIMQLSRPGIGPAPPRLAAMPPARIYQFGNSAVMIARAEPYAGKPAHVTRLRVNRNEAWRMALSYQTTIEAAGSARVLENQLPPLP